MNALSKCRTGLAQSLRETVAYIISIAVLSLVAGSLAFAGNLDDIKKRGYMVVATEDDYPPFEAVVDGKPYGYDHALLAILKKQAGFDIRQEILPWQGILPGVASGNTTPPSPPPSSPTSAPSRSISPCRLPN